LTHDANALTLSDVRSNVTTARLRGRNQLTLPDPVVRAAGLGKGDRFVVEVGADEPDTIVLRRIRPSYAGALHGVYGDPEAYITGERRSWELGDEGDAR